MLDGAGKASGPTADSFGVSCCSNTAAYNLLISAPRDARAQSKTITGNLQGEFDATDEALGMMDDLINQFSPVNQKFVDDYNNARTVVDTAASHASPVPPTPPNPQTQTRV